MELADLVKYEESDPEALEEAHKAMGWIYAKPEGQAMLEKAYALYGKPITIIAHQSPKGASTPYNHLALHRNAEDTSQVWPVIYVSTELLHQSRLVYADGTVTQPYPLDRMLSHELTHATQSTMMEELGEYQKILQAAQIEMFGTMKKSFQAIKHQVQTAQNDAARVELLGDFYDTHMAPQLNRKMDELLRKLAQDPKVQHYVKAIEVPAIEFENLMVTKYKGEKPRSTNYIESDIGQNLCAIITKSFFVNAGVQFFAAKQAAANQREGNNPQEIRRPDAGAKQIGSQERQ